MERWVLSINNQKEKGWALAKWRPFQLAFLLSQLEGIVNPNSTTEIQLTYYGFQQEEREN